MKVINYAGKAICLVLVITLLLGSTVSLGVIGTNNITAKAAWDGHLADASDAKSVSLIDFGNVDSIESFGGVADSMYAVGGYSLYWSSHSTSPTQFNIYTFPNDVPKDWTNYEGVVLKIYSERPTNAKIRISFHSPRNSANTTRYYYDDLVIDWSGWKTITFDFKDMTSRSNPSLYTMAERIQLEARENWGANSNSLTEIWISEFYLNPVNSDFASDFYGEEKIAKAYEALKDSVAVHADGISAVTGDGKYPLGYAVEYISQTVTVPVEFFKDFLSADVICEGNTYKITLNGVTVSGSVDSSIVSKNSEAHTLGVTPYSKDGYIYVPGAQIGELLGLSALRDGRLLAVGTPKMKATLIRPNSLGVNELNEIAAYESYRRQIDVASLTPADTQKAKDNWRISLVGDETTNDLSDPDIKSKIDLINKNAEKSWALLESQPQYAVFDDKVLDSPYALEDQYDHVQNLALAYACYGSKYYKNEQMYNDIIYCLDFLGTNYYGAEARLAWENSGQLTGLNNWYEWDVEIPGRIINILMCVGDKLTAKEIDKYLEYFYTRFTFPFDNGYNYIETGKLILGSSLLRNDYNRILSVLDDILKTYLYVDDNERMVSNKIVERPGQEVNKKGSGLFTDGSYVFHTFHAMSGLYGASHFEAASELENVISGTIFDINSPAGYNLEDFFLSSLDPVIFGTAMYRSVTGRGGADRVSGIPSLVRAYSVAPSFGTESQQKIYSIVKTAYVTSPYKSTFISNLEIDEIKKFKEMIADETIPVIQDHDMSRIYYNMDKVVHERQKWGMSISMSSSRIFNYESINGENTEGWYLGDGRTEWLLRDSDINATNKYWAYMDPYRMPGTTVDTQKRQAVSIYVGNEFLSSKDFVGGVTLDGKYSAAAMDAESYHYDTDFGVDGGGNGGLAPAHKNDLTAKKAYFMLDDGFICLGTAINAKDNNDAEVLTIIDNMLSTETVSVREGVVSGDPYTIISAVADNNPEPENLDINTIDDNYSTKWAGNYGEIVWDMGTVNTLGFINLAFQNGNKRSQNFELLISTDGVSFESVFDGKSSGTTASGEAFDLRDSQARYVKFINKGNSAGSGWVSILECSIYPTNPDGSIGLAEPDVYGADPIYVDGIKTELGGDDYSLNSPNWINFNDSCGYWFPTDNKTENEGNLKMRWTNNSMSHFELWFSHGVNPTDSGYAYGVLPGATKEQTKAFAESGSVQILSNNPKLQAIHDTRTNLTYIVFWEAGTFNGITASEPCMIIVKETQDGYKLAFSDPSQKLNKSTVTINKNLTVVKLDEFASVSANETQSVIDFDLSVAPGRTLECEFDISEENTTVTPSDDNDVGNKTSSSVSGGSYPSITVTVPFVPENNVPIKTEPVFKDLSDYEWAKESIVVLCNKGIVSMPENKEFRPGDNITREEFVKLLVCAFVPNASTEYHHFTDVSDGAWYMEYITKAYNSGITKGLPDGSFGVGKYITREDMVTMASRTIEIMGAELPVEGTLDFNDKHTISTYAVDYVDALSSLGVVNGMEDGNFSPKANANRAQAAKIIAQLLTLYR